MGRRGASILTLANGGCRNLWYDYSLISGTIESSGRAARQRVDERSMCLAIGSRQL